MLSTQCLDELKVLLLGVVFVEDAEMRLAPVKRLGGLPEAASEAVVDEGVLQDLLQELGRLSTLLEVTGLEYAPEEHPQRRACPWEPR